MPAAAEEAAASGVTMTAMPVMRTSTTTAAQATALAAAATTTTTATPAVSVEMELANRRLHVKAVLLNR